MKTKVAVDPTGNLFLIEPGSILARGYYFLVVGYLCLGVYSLKEIKGIGIKVIGDL